MSNPFDDLKDDGDEIVDEDDSEEGTDDQDDDVATAENDARESPAETATSTVSESSDPGSSTAVTQSSQSTSDSTSTSAPDSASTSATATPESTSTPEPSREREPGTDADDDRSDPAETGPAFEYSEVRQKPLYARDETWNELEDELGITVTPELRRKGIRDEETREIHDAILKVAIEHIDEIPDVIADERLESA